MDIPKLLELFKEFNAKERYFLVGEALGNRKYELSEKFRKRIGKAIGIAIPKDAFAAMDYHLDWLYACLMLASTESEKGVFENTDNVIKAQQEDIDFIIAFKHDKKCCIVLIEAKGVSHWGNKQMKSKVKRLKQIFGESGTRWNNVFPHFIMMSPKKPDNVATNDVPEWMLCERAWGWVELTISDFLKGIERCDVQGKKNRKGEYWKAVKRKTKAVAKNKT